MALLPVGETLAANQTIETRQQSSRTYRLDLVNERIAGMVDEMDAVKQAVFKILQTERFEYPIYSVSYGVELGGLIGAEPAFLRSEFKRRITEALLQDDRIEEVNGFEININGDEALIQFTVVSQYGSFQQEVRRSV